MKKIILSLTCIFILNSCKQNESTKETTKPSDSTSTSAKGEEKKPCDYMNLATYESCGQMITISQADFGICLADPAKTKNTYTIANVYNVSDSNGNKIVVHLKDLFGKDMSPENDYILKDTLDFKNIKDIINAKKIDPYTDIEVVVFHENNISDGDMLAKAAEIYKLAQTHDCDQVKIQIGAKESATEFRSPKTCGTGTIRPLYKSPGIPQN